MMRLKKNPNSAKLDPLDKNKIKQEEKANKSFNSALYSGSGKTEYLPKLDDDEEHPMPYFITATATLPRPAEKPWEGIEEKRARKRLDHWLQSKAFQYDVLDELLADVLVDDLSTAASVALQEGQYKLKKDRVKAAYIEEEIVPSVVSAQAMVAVWEELVDEARGLDANTFEEMQKRLGEAPLDAEVQKLLRQHVSEEDDWKASMDDEKALSGLTWETLVFHYHQILSQAALQDNFALTQLQEMLVTQCAGAAIMAGANDASDRDLQDADEAEKVNLPPRMG